MTHQEQAGPAKLGKSGERRDGAEELQAAAPEGFRPAESGKAIRPELRGTNKVWSEPHRGGKTDQNSQD